MDAWPGFRRGGAFRSVVASVAAPGAATGLALALPHHTPASAASVYILGVVAAAAIGGVWSGLAAAVLSFVGLNYFFAQPLHTFEIQRPDELVALAVFVVVALVVGALVARVFTERDRAERTTAEATTLAAFTGRLLVDESIERTLQAAAASIAELFDVSFCRIEGRVAESTISAETRREPASVGDVSSELELVAGSARLGRIRVERTAGRGTFTSNERRSLSAFAAQLALALQRASSEAAIQGARLEAEASDMRAALFSSVTHDLRTPLASITASVSSLLDPEVIYDREQREELLRTSLEEANRLNRMVGNLLDLARIRSGVLRPTSELISIEDVIESVLRRLQPLLQPFAVRTEIRPVPDVELDPIQIDQALTNILENAARFSRPGSEIRISVYGWEGRVGVRIADEGPGIDPSDRERVFEPFYKADRGAGRGGTGLGLAIARAITIAHGGHIRIEGTPRGGTAVVLELPAGSSSTAPVREAAESS
jgi:two-component system, OmpR family, sensor histidine kinase KdpD